MSGDREARDLVQALLDCREDERRALDDLLWRHRALYDAVEAEDLQAALRRSDIACRALAEWLRWSE